jgi:hypothetical protein
MEMNWSRWFRCESSLGLVLVPSQPGVYALAEEIIEPVGPQSRRMLAVFEVNEAEDMARSLSWLFAEGSQWRQKLSERKCYVRYALTADAAERHAAADALRHWLETQRGVAAQIFGPGFAQTGATAPSASSMEAEPDNELKTVAERAVDRVTRATEYAGVFPAGI